MARIMGFVAQESKPSTIIYEEPRELPAKMTTAFPRDRSLPAAKKFQREETPRRQGQSHANLRSLRIESNDQQKAVLFNDVPSKAEQKTITAGGSALDTVLDEK